MARKTAGVKPRRKNARRAAPATAKRSAAAPVPASDLSETESELLQHLRDGYEVETDTLGGDVLLRRSKNEEAIRPLSATRNTIEALQQRGLIAPAKAADPLRLVWRLKQPGAAKKSARTRTRVRQKP